MVGCASSERTAMLLREGGTGLLLVCATGLVVFLLRKERFDKLASVVGVNKVG